MTPLAQQMVRRATGPQCSEASEEDAAILATLLAFDTKCFEVTEVYASTVFEEMFRHVHAGNLDLACDDQIFLPAPAVWIEFLPAADKNRDQDLAFLIQRGYCTVEEVTESANGVRMGALMQPGAETRSYRLSLLGSNRDGNFKKSGTAEVKFLPGAKWASRTITGFKSGVPSMALWFFALHVINTPLIFKQVVHEPHAGLRRELLRAGVLTGKQRLSPWTTIKMDVQTPAHLPGGGGRMTGLKALHFCRAHLRLKRGKVEWVRSHWRGDAANGVVHRDYRIAA